MGTLLDLASLVVVPSGYKEDKIYSVVPTDGSGDLDFTRASNATRVNSAGLIEKVRTNLLLQSNQFDTTWANTRSTDTSGQAGYDGTSNAWLLESTASPANEAYIRQTISASGSNTFSIYAKAGTSNFIGFYIDATSGIDPFAFFNLSTGAVGSTSATATASIVAVGGGWYRCSVAVNATIQTCDIYVVDADGSFNSTSGANIVIQNSQLESGDIATDYIPTTSAAVSVGMTADVPRLDYLGSSCPSLLLEPQRTNDIFPSEDFSGYTGSSVTISINQAVSPDGFQNADLMYPATSGNFAGKYKNVGATTTGVVSCFVKQAGKRYAIIGTDNNATYTCIFDLETATVVYEATNYTGSIESFNNGWYRISAVYTSSTAGAYPFIGLADNSSGGVVIDGTNGIYIWGFQYERNASYVTSYIPTLSTSVTRVADVASKTGISSLIGQMEGVVFLDFTVSNLSETNNEKVLWYMRSGGSGERYVTLVNNAQLIYVENNGSTIAQIIKTGLTIGRHKCAIAYATNDFVFYVDGVLIGTDVSGTPSGFSEFGLHYYISTYIGSQNVNQAILFKTRLSNTELAQLTTL